MFEKPSGFLNSYTWYAKKNAGLLQIGQQALDLLPAFLCREPEQLSLFAEGDAQPALFGEPDFLTDRPYMIFSTLVSPAFRARMIAAWDAMHETLKAGLLRRGVSIHVPVTTLEYRAERLSNSSNAGHYNIEKRLVVVPQLDSWSASLLLPKSQPTDVFYHEIGHAVDYTYGKLSDQEGFRLAHTHDTEALRDNAEAWDYFWYYLWSEGCREEAFTGVWGSQAMRAMGVKEDSDEKLFEDYFPKTWEWVAANAPSARDGFCLPRKTINQVDGAERTPIEVLEEALDDEEFSHVLDLGANPLRLTPALGTSLLERCIARKQTARVRAIVLDLAANPMLTSGLVSDANVCTLRRSILGCRDILAGDAGCAAAIDRLASV